MLEIFVPVYNFLTICEVVQLDFNTLALSGNSEIYKKILICTNAYNTALP